MEEAARPARPKSRGRVPAIQVKILTVTYLKIYLITHLPVVMIGILAQNDDFYIFNWRRVERVEYLLSRGEDLRLAFIFGVKLGLNL